MKKLLNVLVWIIIAPFVWFSIEFISEAADKQNQKSDWGHRQRYAGSITWRD